MYSHKKLMNRHFSNVFFIVKSEPEFQDCLGTNINNLWGRKINGAWKWCRRSSSKRNELSSWNCSTQRPLSSGWFRKITRARIERATLLRTQQKRSFRWMVQKFLAKRSCLSVWNIHSLKLFPSTYIQETKAQDEGGPGPNARSWKLRKRCGKRPSAKFNYISAKPLRKATPFEGFLISSEMEVVCSPELCAPCVIRKCRGRLPWDDLNMQPSASLINMHRFNYCVCVCVRRRFA